MVRRPRTDCFDTYKRPNVELVNLREEPIESITAHAVDTASRHFELDALVFATGFDAVTGALLAVDIRGRKGVTLKDVWSEGPAAHLGLTVAGFPNLFAITGPGSPSVIGNVITKCEYHRLDCRVPDSHAPAPSRHDRARPHRPGRLGRARRRGRRPHALSESQLLVPGRQHSRQAPRVFMPYIGEDYRTTCKRIVADGYRGFVFGTSAGDDRVTGK